ncbi:putative NEDD8 ultimate buster 1 [Apostichopus japonicus]|uniref:Putative NEDD8 ultimate buster 1 n=1 Tax=Stichopus japonicus TaxID=307972 RepID=A0A2G8KGW5_STIJA|nr:putative NEDD8 ultimate buster 1 [Apostichopus japonicus]
MADRNEGITQAVKDAVKRKLNTDRVKLWLPPYSKEDGTLGEYPEDVVQQYSTSLNLSVDVLLEIFEELRQHALAKLAARKQFQETGLATLKIKVPGNISSQKKLFDISFKLEEKADVLREQIASDVQLPKGYLKLIANGRVLQSNESLKDQGVCNYSHVMVVLLSETEKEALQKEDSLTAIQRTKEAAQLLSNKKYGTGLNEDNFFLQITDQNGKTLALPAEERAALSVALTLNEKGRASLKKKDYSTAVLFLLESETAFNHCRSDILQAVDNFAILCLDIVWCYLCLQNIDQLPNAGEKLKICEESFKRSHGPNMERLQTLKGDKGKDLALYVKLYLLQGILYFHQGNSFECRRLLEKSENILKLIQIDETKLMQLVAMGYSISEARLGLRSANGSVSEAITKISERKERKKSRAKQEKEDARKSKIAKKLGKSANGEWIKVDVYEQLLDMGFPSGVTAAALRQTNSDLQLSLEAIQNHPEWYDVPDISFDEPSPDWTGNITDEMLAQITEMGFDVHAARNALLKLKGDIQKAVQELAKHGGHLPSTSSLAAMSSTRPEDSLSKDEEEAMAELAPDIPEHDEDYLDLTLEDETQFLEEYKIMLASSASTET